MASFLISILISLLSYQHQTGWASRYDPGIMAHVADYHGIDTTPYDGAAAALSCDDIGQVWHVRPEAGGEWRSIVIVDCAGDVGTFEWMRDNGILLELDYQTGIEFGAVSGGARVEVLRP